MKLFSIRHKEYVPYLIIVAISPMLLLLFDAMNTDKDAWALASTSKNNNSKITSVYEINTRLNTNDISTTEYPGYGYPLKNITELYESCPKEVVIFVHGWGNSEYDTVERLDRVKMSLENNTYKHFIDWFQLALKH